jgi:uncharacterized protein YecA (UPF0149 family)
MHTPTGEIRQLTDEEEKLWAKESNQQFYESLEKTQRLFDRQEKMVALSQNEAEKLEPLSKKQRKGWMRNQPCVCGSGKKFKKCCWGDFK